MSSFEMLVKEGGDSSLYNKKLVSEINGVPKSGYVFTIYARLDNFDSLAEAKSLENRVKSVLTETTDIQGNLVSVYLHKVNEDGYYMTTKLRTPNTAVVEQVNVPISESSFNHLSRISSWATPFERYRIPSVDRKLEWVVDVFRDGGGRRHNWVKMDIEVPDLECEVPKFPIPVEEYILDFPGIVTKEQVVFIKRLWSRQWFSEDPNWQKSQVEFRRGDTLRADDL